MWEGEGLRSQASSSYKNTGWHKTVDSTRLLYLDIWVVGAFLNTSMKLTFYLSNATCGDGLLYLFCLGPKFLSIYI